MRLLKLWCLIGLWCVTSSLSSLLRLVVVDIELIGSTFALAVVALCRSCTTSSYSTVSVLA